MIVTPPGNTVQTWEPTLAVAPELRLEDLAPVTPGARLIVLSAHPDDETIGAGRLIAEWARTVGPVQAITLTGGEACLDHVGVHIPGLKERRREEWGAALTCLGGEPLGCWHLSDGGVGMQMQRVVRDLARLCSARDVILAPWRHDPHPDHSAAGSAAALAARQCGAGLVEYPVWATFWSQPEVLAQTGFRVVRVHVSPSSAEIRERALDCYRTQRQALREDLTPVVPDTMLKHHRHQLAFQPWCGTDG